jgi:hypothetical protein
MVALFLFLKGMTCALAPFSYLVQNIARKKFLNAEPKILVNVLALILTLST